MADQKRKKYFHPEIDPDLRRLSNIKQPDRYKPLCRYDRKCNRTDALHMRDFRHSTNPPRFSLTLSERKPQKRPLHITPEKSDKTPVITNYLIKKRKDEGSTTASKSDTTKNISLPKDNSMPKDIPPPNQNLLPNDTPQPKVINKSANEWKSLLCAIFMVQMPDDFLLFWDFCKIVSPKNPLDALRHTLGYRLVGPFDVLAGFVDETNIHKDDDDILTHWRFFYDPPELQTFAVVDENSSLSFDTSNSYHLGYFRDTPRDHLPVVVSNDPETSCVITGVADNIFAAIASELSKRKAKSNSNKSLMNKIESFESQLKSFADKNKIDLNANQKLEKRKKKINAETFHKFGILVNVVNGVGYRCLPQCDTSLKKLLERIINYDNDEQKRKCASMEEVHKIMHMVNIANDEKDFGMGLELGIDLFCTGHSFFHKSATFLLKNAYELLGRYSFVRIIKAHLANRRKGNQLSIIPYIQ